MMRYTGTNKLRHIPYMRNGVEVSREEFDRTAKNPPRKRKRKNSSVPMIGGAYSEANPLMSLAMSVPEKSIPMMNAEIKRQGISGVEYVPGAGRRNCRITSRAGRARWMSVFGKMVDVPNTKDNDGGYGDG